MFTLIKALLADAACAFCGVGDRDQVIHQSHGADAAFMDHTLALETARKVARPSLSKSFRYASGLAKWMGRHTARSIVSADVCATHIERYDYATPTEAEEALVQCLKDWKREQGAKAGESTVLLRHASQSMLLENALHQHRISYRCVGFASYLQRPEVLFVRAVYAIASRRWDTLGGPLTRSLIPAALFEMSHTPPQDPAAPDPDFPTDAAYLQEAGRLAAESEQVIHDIVMHQLMARAPGLVKKRLKAAIAAVQGGLDLRPDPDPDPDPCSFPAFLAALDLPAIAREVFVDPERRAEVTRHMQGLLASAGRYASVLDFFQSLQAQDEALAEAARGRAEGKVTGVHRLKLPVVQLASVSHVKGLEFRHVVLPYLEQGRFPDARAPLLDERRLFYVGATRAISRLSLICHRTQPSSFLSSLTA